MGKKHDLKKSKQELTAEGDASTPPKKLEGRRATRAHSRGGIMVGRTIGAKREHLETRNERAAARQKDKRKNAIRITVVSIAFLIIIAVLIIVAVNYFASKREEPAEPIDTPTVVSPAEPTIEIIDEGSTTTEGRITSRMREYIALAEADFKALDLTPIKAILPAGSIREVDFYLEGHPGRIKMIIDRGSAVSAEDASRVLRYLAENGITEYEYIDVRIEGKAYWK